MKLIYQDLLNFLSDKPTKELLSEKLFQLGHEHEINGDVFEMELTPNRGDCLSLIGLARDLNVFFGNSKALNIYEGDIDTLEINFENLSTFDCPQISFLEIEIEDAAHSYKPYIENYFNEIGNKKTNLFTDISNFISYELGQPTHCFDREKINKKLIFENKECNETFNTLLGSEIMLEDKNCVFSLDEEIISLAGVMGGASTACSTKTKKVLVECAYFNPESIIGKSIKYNLISDAAHKFERGVDILSQEKVLRRFIHVLQDHAVIKTLRFKSFGSHDFNHQLIPFDLSGTNKILGTSLNELDYLSYLQKLGFEITDNIKVPSYRHDIRTKNDIAEEIARAIGYDNIPRTPIRLKKTVDNKIEEKITIIESFLTKNGFNEVINFPFTSKKDEKSIVLDNPLDSSRGFLRTSLKDSLVENLLYNERRQKDSIKLFEISNLYTKHQAEIKNKKLGIIISGRLSNDHIGFSKKLDFKYLNQLMNEGLEKDVFKVDEISRNSLDTKNKDKIFYVEVGIDDIPDTFFSFHIGNKEKINFIKYMPVSDFPSSTRDFSFSVTNLALVDEVISMLNEISDEIIKKSFIFDFYKNEKTNTVKLGFRLILQSKHKTLSDEEITKKTHEVISPILKLNGVSIPGM